MQKFNSWRSQMRVVDTLVTGHIVSTSEFLLATAIHRPRLQLTSALTNATAANQAQAPNGLGV